MGAKLTKLNCFKRCRKANKVITTRRSTDFVLREHSRQEQRPSSDIIKDLKNIGIITEKSGGAEFFVKICNGKSGKKKPRRLPAIVCPERQHIKLADATLKQGNDTQYDREEKDLMTEIRRIGALAEKGNIARKSEERRKQVLARREENLRRKIKKTEEKLRKDSKRRDQMKKDSQNAKIIENSKGVTVVVGDVLPSVSV